MPSDNIISKSPAEAAEAVVAWHTNGADARLSIDEVAKTAIAFHNALLGLDDGGDPAGIGMRYLLTSLMDYTADYGIEFHLLAMQVDAQAVVCGALARGYSPIADKSKLADAGTRNLLLTLHEYAENSGFRLVEVVDELIEGARAELIGGLSV
jgi:hypothetical protein